MKKIMLLGGSPQQVVAIETAKRLGYETVLCDYLPDNPGKSAADRFYQISTTDQTAVLAVAQKENIDGILAYASDPAAPTAAYVAEKMGLPGNPYESVEILCKKDKFRAFLKQNGFSVPKCASFQTYEDAKGAFGEFSLPVMVKPVDSSGSKGATVLRRENDLEQAFSDALSFSREKRVIIEEYIEKKHTYLIGGDIFVHEGEVVLWGLLNCHRDKRVNPLVPVGKSYPLSIGDADMTLVKETLKRLVSSLHISFGGMNVELVIDREDRVWLIDVGPRCGGNMIPDLLGMIFDTDVVDLSVRCAMGEEVSLSSFSGDGFFATHNLHTDGNGILKSIEFSEKISPYIIRKNIYTKPGEPVEYFDHAAKTLGIIFMKFPTKECMEEVLRDTSSHIIIHRQEERI